MHFIAFVVTNEKPTEAVLAAAMAPFGPAVLADDHKWGWWGLGGRYTGLLIPHDMANTIKGNPDAMPPWERENGVRPGKTGPGVDALQHSNLKYPYFDTGGFPSAVVIHEEWYGDGENILLGSKHLLSQMGFHDVAEAFDETEERRMWDAWQHEVADLMQAVRKNCWIAVVDCHKYVNLALKLLPEIQKLHPNVTFHEDEEASVLIMPKEDVTPKGSAKKRLLGGLH